MPAPLCNKTNIGITFGRISKRMVLQQQLIIPILPLVEAYRYLNHNSHDFPNAFRLQNGILSLPCYPEMTKEQIATLVDVVKAFRHQ